MACIAIASAVVLIVYLLVNMVPYVIMFFNIILLIGNSVIELSAFSLPMKEGHKSSRVQIRDIFSNGNITFNRKILTTQQ